MLRFIVYLPFEDFGRWEIQPPTPARAQEALAAAAMANVSAIRLWQKISA
jgi:hypothetical protein